MIVRQARTVVKIYVISKNSRQHKIEDMKQMSFKARFRPTIVP